MYNLAIEAVSWLLSIRQTRRRQMQMLLNNIWSVWERINRNEKFIDLGRSLFNRYGRRYRFSRYGCPQYRNRCKKIIWKQTKYFKRFPNPHKQPSRPRRSGFQPIPASDADTSANRRPPSSAAGTKEREITMKNLIKLAAASLIGMSGLTASATTVAKNIAEAGK